MAVNSGSIEGLLGTVFLQGVFSLGASGTPAGATDRGCGGSASHEAVSHRKVWYEGIGSSMKRAYVHANLL